jgi:hypothetical protein
MPTSLDVLKAVYRERVKEAHPDHGGHADDFREVQRQFEEAVRFLAKAQRKEAVG